MDYKQKRIIRTVGIIVGTIAFAIILGNISEIYPLPFVVVVCVALAVRYFYNKSKGKIDGVEVSRLDLADRWKCACGQYNSKNNESCDGCGASMNR